MWTTLTEGKVFGLSQTETANCQSEIAKSKSSLTIVVQFETSSFRSLLANDQKQAFLLQHFPGLRSAHGLAILEEFVTETTEVTVNRGRII